MDDTTPTGLAEVTKILEAILAKNMGAEMQITIRLPRPAKPAPSWEANAVAIATRLNRPGLSRDRLAQAVCDEMCERSKEPGMTGRGGRTPSAETILRHALQNWGRHSGNA